MFSDGLWRAKWQSSYLHAEAPYTTYTNSAVESMWRAEDTLFGSTKSSATARMFTNVEKFMVIRNIGKCYEEIVHWASGLHEFQPSFLRGAGLWGVQGTPLRSWTCPFHDRELDRCEGNGLEVHDVFFRCKQPFMESCVFAKHCFDDCDELAMENMMHLAFAQSLADANRHDPTAKEEFGLRECRQLMGKSVVVGRKQDASIHGISIGGRTSGTSEFACFIHHIRRKNIGPVGGAMRSIRLRTNKARIPSKKRDQFVKAFTNVCGHRPNDDANDAKEGIAADAVDAAFDRSLEEGLEEVIEGEVIPTAGDDGVSSTDEFGNVPEFDLSSAEACADVWVVCHRCREPLQAPLGLRRAFAKKSARVECRHAGARCSALNRRRAR